MIDLTRWIPLGCIIASFAFSTLLLIAIDHFKKFEDDMILAIFVVMWAISFWAFLFTIATMGWV